MARGFISYRHVEPDESLARALAAALEARRHPVFIDTRIENSKAFRPISKRYVDAALRDTRLRPDQ